LIGAQGHEFVEHAVGDLQRIARLADALLVGTMQNRDRDQYFREQHEAQQHQHDLVSTCAGAVSPRDLRKALQQSTL
jgi:hypothetical protein